MLEPKVLSLTVQQNLCYLNEARSMPAALHVNRDQGDLKPFLLLPVLSVTPMLTKPPMLFARCQQQQQPRANNAQMFPPVTFAHYDSQPCKAQPHTEAQSQKNQSVKRRKCTLASRSTARADSGEPRARLSAAVPLRRGAHARALPLAVKLRLQGRGRKLCAAARRSRPLLLALVSRPHPKSDKIPARARGMRVHSAAPRLPYKLTATRKGKTDTNSTND
ncbi:hypothetical protein MHYP_G00057690 [Metynnis hypsauchen]